MKRVHILRLLILVLLTRQTTVGFNQMCPMQCHCQVVMDLITANCSGQRLIEAFVGVPASIELLDLSHNDITNIDDACFSELNYLRVLLLNRNSISFIDFDAFTALHSLESVNLSNNRLEWLDNRLFEQNRHLTRVNLSGNKFMDLPNEPILRSRSIQAIDLHKSHLTHLHVRYFEDLPNVRTIDLSGNVLIVLNLAAFAANNVLRHVDLRANRIRCDAQFEMSIVWLRRNQINVLNDNCPKVDAVTMIPRKSQRYQALTTINGTSSGYTHTVNPIGMGLNSTVTPSNANHMGYNRIPVLNKKCADNESDSHACHLFEACSSSLLLLLDEIEYKRVRNASNLKWDCGSPQSFDDIVNVRIAFYGGFLLGTIIGVIILYVVRQLCVCIFAPKRRSNQQKQRNRCLHAAEIRPSHANDTPEIIAENYAHNEAVSRINVDAGGFGAIVPANSRRPRQPSRSFFAIFYERPTQRRYYQNATNLVRRISQSRLFLNSSRAQRNEQHRMREANNRSENLMAQTTSAEYNTERARNGELDQEENVDIEIEELNEVELSQQPLSMSASIRSLNVGDINRSSSRYEPNSIRIVASAIDLSTSAERSETPPPPYTVAVNN